jgi:protein-tyrosine phosphatase
MFDYLLTGRFLAIDKQVDRLLARYELSVPREIGVAVFGVRPDYLQAAFDAIDTEFGDMQTYLRDGLGLDAQAQRDLQDRLLT